jgi:hypothetical protein
MNAIAAGPSLTAVVRAGCLFASMVVNDAHERADVDAWFSLRDLAAELAWAESDRDPEAFVFWLAQHDVATCERGCNSECRTAPVLLHAPRQLGESAVSRRGFIVRTGAPTAEAAAFRPEHGSLAVAIVRREYARTPGRKLGDPLPIKSGDARENRARGYARCRYVLVDRDPRRDNAEIATLAEAWSVSFPPSPQRPAHGWWQRSETQRVLGRLHQHAAGWAEAAGRKVPAHGIRALLTDFYRAAAADGLLEPDRQFFPRLATAALLAIGDLVETESGAIIDPTATGSDGKAVSA